MFRPSIRRSTVAALLALAAGCSGDAPLPTSDPSPVTRPDDGLWTASGNPAAIVRLAPGQLGASARAVPATTIATPAATLSAFNTVAFDDGGTLWVASADDSLLLAFSPAALAQSGAHDASVVISSNARSLAGPIAVALDHQHRVWVANAGNGTLVRFDPAQLARSGAPAPAVVISGVGRPSAIAFDAAGSLWVADPRAATLSKYSVAQLLASGSPPPQVVISSPAGAISGPRGLAFDAEGTLWVANVGNATLVAYTRAQLGGTGTPTPHVTITSPREGVLALATGLAFDAAGSLWVMRADGLIEKLERGALAASGEAVTSLQLALDGYAAIRGAAFWPKPPGLPLF